MNVVFTAYFNGKPDDQRDITWEADNSQLDTLINSLNVPLVVFTDCLEHQNTDKVKFVGWDCKRSPYFERWFAYYSYLLEHPEIKKVYCVDATDTEMLRDPFDHMEDDRIYIGDEDQFLGTEWMLENHPEQFMVDFFRGRKEHLLNVGLLGASRDTLIALLGDFIIYANAYQNVGKTEMGIFNYLLHTKYLGRVTHGKPWNTVFKQYENDSSCFWRHK